MDTLFILGIFLFCLAILLIILRNLIRLNRSLSRAQDKIMTPELKEMLEFIQGEDTTIQKLEKRFPHSKTKVQFMVAELVALGKVSKDGEKVQKL